MKKIKFFVYVLVGVLMSTLSIAFGGVCMAGATPGAAGGTIVPGATQTVALAKEHDPDLRLPHIERKVVKVFPQATPLTTLSFYCKMLESNSQEVEYRTVSTLPLFTKTKTNVQLSGNVKQIEMDTENNDIFVKNQTVVFPGIKGYDGNTLHKREFLVAIVEGISTGGKPILKPVNGKGVPGNMVFPDIPVGSTIVRAARAQSELDMQTSAFAALPVKDKQYLQKVCAQVEQSTLDKINEADGEVDWGFSDVEELAIYDMKQTQNVSYLFGTRAKVSIDKEDVYTTGGIWYMPGKDFLYGSGGGNTAWTVDQIVDLTKVTFTGNNGSGKKIMLAGSACLASLMKARMPEGYTANANMVERFNLTFSEIKSDFGTLLVVLDETFDAVGLESSAIIIDPEFLRKYSIGGIGTVDLDLKKSGQKDADARVIREISGLILQNPNSHVRVSVKP